MTYDFKAEAKKRCDACAVRGLNGTHTCHAFLAGAARGVEVGEEAFKRAEDERIEWVRRGERAEELCEELKAQLDTMERIAKHRVESIDKMLTAIREFIPLFDEYGRTGKTPEGYYEAWKELSEYAERAYDYFSKRGAR